MNLSAPTKPFFLISLVLIVLAVIGFFAAVPYVSANTLWLALAAYAVLACGTLFKGA